MSLSNTKAPERLIIDRGYGREGYRLFFNQPFRDRPFEAPMQWCAHCGCGVIMNPERKRPRGHCRVCTAYICDECVNLGPNIRGHLWL